MAAPVQVVGGRNGLAAIVQNHYQPAGIEISERLQQHAVHDAEDGRVGTDPQGKREDRREREDRVMAERAVLLVSEQAARAEAERSNRAKDEFLAIVSHDFA